MVIRLFESLETATFIELVESLDLTGDEYVAIRQFVGRLDAHFGTRMQMAGKCWCGDEVPTQNRLHCHPYGGCSQLYTGAKQRWQV